MFERIKKNGSAQCYSKEDGRANQPGFMQRKHTAS